MDEYVVGLDASDALQGAETLKQAINIVNSSFDKITNSAIKFNTEGQQVGATLKGIAQNGESVSVTLQRVNSEWVRVAESTSRTSRQFDAAYESSKKFTTALYNQSNAIKTASSPAEVLKYKDALSNLTTYMARLDDKQRGMAGIIWADVQAGRAKVYGEALQGLQSKLIAVKSAQDGLGASGRAAFQQQLKDVATFNTIFSNASQDIIRKRQQDAAQLSQLYATASQMRQTESFVSGQASGKIGAATPKQVNEYTAALASLKSFQVQHQISAQAIQNMWTQLGTVGPKPYIGQLAQVQVAVGKVMAAMNQLGATKPPPSFSPTLLLNWQTFAKFFEARLLYQSIFEVVNLFKQGAADALVFGQKVSQIQTLVEQNSGSAKDWADSIKRISAQYGGDALDVAKSYYSAISNQIGRTVLDIEGFTRQTQAFAQTTASTAEEANNLFASVINSYQLSVGQTSQISAELFKTIDLGRVTASEMANSIGRVLVPAKQLGVAYQEVFAGIAVLTQKGVSPADSMTQLLNVMNKLIKPTDALKELFKEWGVETGQQAISTFGFTGVLQRLSTELESRGIARLGELVNDIRGFRGVLGLAGENLGLFKTSLDSIFGAGSQYSKAIDTTFNTPAKQMQIELQKAKLIFLDLGEQAIAASVKGIQALGGLDTILKQLGNLIMSTVVGGLAYFAASAVPRAAAVLVSFRSVVAGVTVAFNSLKAAMISNPFTAIAVAVGLVAEVFFNMESAVEAATRRTADFTTKAMDDMAVFNAALYKNLALSQEAVKKQYQDLLTEGTKAARGLADIQRDLQGVLTGYVDVIKSTKERELAGITDQIQQVNSEIAKSKSALESVDSLIKRATKERDAEAFSEKVAPGVPAVAKVRAYFEEFSRLEAEINDSLRQGDLERYKLAAEELLTREKNYSALRKEIQQTLNVTLDANRLEQDQRLADVRFTQQQIGANNTLTNARLRQGRALSEHASIQTRMRSSLEANLRMDQALATTGLQREAAALQYEQRTDAIAKKTQQIKDLTAALLEMDRGRVDASGFLISTQERGEAIAKAQREQAEKDKAALKEQHRTLGDLYDQLVKLTKISVGTKLELFDKDQVVTSDLILEKYKDLRTKITEAGGQISFGDLRSLDEVIRQQAQSFTLEEAIKKNVEETNKARERQLKIQEEAAKRQEDLNKAATEQSIIFVKAQEEYARASNTMFGGMGFKQFTTFDIKTAGKDQLEALTEELNKRRQILDIMQRSDTGSVQAREAFRAQEDAVAQAVVAITRYQQMTAELQQVKQVVYDSTSVFAPVVTATADLVKKNQDNVKTYQDLVRTTAELNAQVSQMATTVNAVIQQTPIPGRVVPVNKASGGIIHGSDRIPALLAPGEFVMSQRNTRSFYSQLVGMNSGLSTMAAGGHVGTNVGDIHINMNASGNPSTDVVAIGKLLRREIRRGTVSFK